MEVAVSDASVHANIALDRPKPNLSDVELLVAVRIAGQENADVREFFTSVEDGRQPVIIRGNYYRWESIEHVFRLP